MASNHLKGLAGLILAQLALGIDPAGALGKVERPEPRDPNSPESQRKLAAAKAKQERRAAKRAAQQEK
jgi:hypothetical protein